MDKNYLVSTLVYNNDFKGVKESILKSSNIAMIEFTRDIITNISKYELIMNSGIYILFLENNQIYIGQSVNVYERIKTHNFQDVKDFNKVLAFVTNDNQFSKTFIDYCEWYFINKVNNQQNFYKLTNDKKRESEPKLNTHDRCEVEAIIDGIEQLLYFSGINFNKTSNNKIDVFYLNNCQLIYRDGKYIMLKDSYFRFPNKMNNDKDNRVYNSFIEYISENEESIEIKDNVITLLNDIEISSSSFAGALVKNAVSCNGWTTWKNQKGQTLDEVYRKK